MMAEEWIIFGSSVLFFLGVRKMLFPDLDLIVITPLILVSLLFAKAASYLPLLDFKEVPPLLLITRFLVWGSFTLVAIQNLAKKKSFGLFYFLYFVLCFLVFPANYYLVQGFQNLLPFQIWDKSGSIFLFTVAGSFLWLYGVFSPKQEIDEPKGFLPYFFSLPFALSAFSVLPNPEAHLHQGFISLFSGLFSVLGSILFTYLSGKRQFSETNLSHAYIAGIALSAASITALEEVIYPWAFMGGLLFQWVYPFLLEKGWGSRVGGFLLALGFFGSLGAALPAVLYPAEELPHSFYTMLGVQFLGICSAFLISIFFGSLFYVFSRDSEVNFKMDNAQNE